MNLQPMSPHPFDASGRTFRVFCCRCNKCVSSADVVCDIDAPAGTYYCGDCAIHAELDDKNGGDA